MVFIYGGLCIIYIYKKKEEEGKSHKILETTTVVVALPYV